MESTSQDKREKKQLEPGSPTEPVPFGKFYLLGLIARGGMAEVYRARQKDITPPELLAIKVMRPQLAREQRFVDMFRREGGLAMLLYSPSIVRTYEVGTIDECHFIAMEYIAGRDLTQCLRRCQETSQRIPVPHAVYIASRIAEGLSVAHNLRDEDGRPLNVVNRDVSPSNVRLSYDGDIKLLDFGIAQGLMNFMSEIGVLKGKFSYMSPEQIRGMPLDARTDVFSTGIILHEMLTTEKLFRGDTEFALMEKVRKAEVPRPSRFNRRVTEELDRVVLRALARDVDDRYQSADELGADLRRLLEGYSFDPKELRQFMRQLFRKEYGKEQAEEQAALRSLPAQKRPPPIPEPDTDRNAALARAAQSGTPPRGPATSHPVMRPGRGIDTAQGLGLPGRLPGQPGNEPEDQPDYDATPEPGREERPRGFWSRIMRRKP